MKQNALKTNFLNDFHRLLSNPYENLSSHKLKEKQNMNFNQIQKMKKLNKNNICNEKNIF